jgi:hypothetical protein
MPFHEGAPMAFIQIIEITTTQRPMVMPGSDHNRGT